MIRSSIGNSCEKGHPPMHLGKVASPGMIRIKDTNAEKMTFLMFGEKSMIHFLSL